MKFKDIKGDQVDLIEAGEWGLQDMYEYGKNSLFYQFMETKPFKSIEETREYLNKWIALSKEGTGFFWLIFLKKGKKVIGSISLWDINWRRRSVGYGYGLSPDYQGKGYLEEALLMVLKLLFCELNFHRVHGIIPRNNIPSIVVVQKFGFKREGVLRDYYLYLNENWEDGILVSLLKHEFVAYLKRFSHNTEIC